MKVLIADKFSEHQLRELQQLGVTVVYDPELKEQSLVQALARELPHILVVRSTQVTGEMLGSAKPLTLVVRAGAGVNTIDLETASRLGIFVANCPGKNSVAVAELVIGLIIALDRRIPDNVFKLRNGEWDKKTFSAARGIKGARLGLLGFGSISREVAKRARALEMEVLVWSRSLTDEEASEASVRRLDSPKSIAKDADIVSVHLAAAPGTLGLCNAEFFGAMKNGALFINTSRGDIVDEQALMAAITSRNLRVGLDVFQNEPAAGSASWQSALAAHPNVYGTHHIGASTAQAEAAIGKEAVRIITTFIRSGDVLNCVNLDLRSPATHMLTVRHLNRVGVLAAILGEIQKANINVLEMENAIFAGDDAAIAKIRLGEGPTSNLLQSIESAHAAIISVSVVDVKS